ncbi:hypothetical protein [Thiorhodovibrio winogradskyi]|nr:hypothetical protein [Thiorhodovibrio winogradskyi]
MLQDMEALQALAAVAQYLTTVRLARMTAGGEKTQGRARCAGEDRDGLQ